MTREYEAEPLPPPTPEEFQRELAQARVLAQMMDSQYSVMGVRFGWDAIIGLMPVVGDTLAVIPALYPIYIAKKHNLPRHLVARMTMNVIADYGIGLVPVAGDLLDVAFKASIRNVKILEEWAAKQEHKRGKGRVVEGEIIDAD